MNGYNQGLENMGVMMQPDSSAMARRRPSNRLEIHNLPTTHTQEGIETLLSAHGTLKKFTLVNSPSGPYVSVIYDTPEDAKSAFEKLNNYNYEGSQLKVDIMNNNPASGRINRGRPGRNQGFPGPNRSGTGYPLRIMVPSEYVGAIIGRKGQTIKSITQRCKARVDVHGKENTGLIEKVISIFGQPENCTNACKEILQVMQHESTSNNRGEIMLKMITDDRYCGRIIGKEGKMIKKIRDDTSTKITVSNAQEMAALFPDRVIAIRGTIDNMCQAEAAISVKLQECYEQDQGQNLPGMMLPMTLGPNTGGYYNSRPFDHGQNFYPSLYPPIPQQQPQQPQAGGGMMVPAGDSCQVSVPNAAVGAIIGAGGSNIKQMMRESGAFINIESKKDGDPSVERVVTIKGNSDACWRASYMVFEKMKSEGFAGNDEVRLKTAIKIPKSLVGRIIGKAGKNVRELQRVTGAMIKLPEDPATQGDEVTVEVFGNFLSTQSAHGRIRSLVNQFQQQNFNGVMARGPGPRSGPPSSSASLGPRQNPLQTEVPQQQ